MTVKLGVKGTPVGALVVVLKAACSLGCKKHVTCVKTCAVEPQSQIQDGRQLSSSALQSGKTEQMVFRYKEKAKVNSIAMSSLVRDGEGCLSWAAPWGVESTLGLAVVKVDSWRS